MLNQTEKNEKKPIAELVYTCDKDEEYLEHVLKHHMPEGLLRDVLAPEVPYWKPQTPVMIEAPTGSGKSTFVYQELIPRCLHQGGHLLLLSNRVALSYHQKMEIIEVLNSPLKKRLTPEGVLRQEDFGAVRVMTYHRLAALLKDETAKSWRSKVQYVVCDEAHFFAADAPFNSNCDYILRNVVTKFQHAVRIYMTATPDHVLNGIARAEEQRWSTYDLLTIHYVLRKTAPFHHYWRTDLFEWVDLHFFQSMKTILDKISENKEEKWLVFVDSKQHGKDLVEDLPVPAAYLDAEHKSGRTWEMLLEKERFEEQVLVTTAVLDTGINIWDDAVRNIVVMADDKTELIQMLGRKRRRGKESVCLWVKDMSMATINRRYHSCCDKLKWYAKLDANRNYAEDFPRNLSQIRQNEEVFKAELWRAEDIVSLRPLFTFSKGGYIYANEMAREELEYRRAFLYRLRTGKLTFQDAVRQWLHKEKSVVKNEVERFYQAHVDEVLGEDLQAELRRLIVNACEEAGFHEPQPTRIDELQTKALNNRLQKLTTNFNIIQVEDGWMITAQKSENN